MTKLRNLIIVFLSLILFFFLIDLYNQQQVSPNSSEINAILSVFPQANSIKSKDDILFIQNQVIDSILHSPSSFYPIDIINDLNLRKGQCFNRSLLLQKILVLNGFKIRPVYLFFSSTSKTSPFDFFRNKIYSHAIFEVKVDGNWFVIRTNTKMHEFENIDQYLVSPLTPVPMHSRYIRYLSNRNGKFLRPLFLPDIYGFF